MQLVIKSGPGAGQQYDLGGKPLTLGADPTSEIPVADATMAGQHARLENIGNTLYVTDLASDKGTFLNGQRMSPAARYPLRAGDMLQIGATFFQIQASPVPAETTATPQPPSDSATLQPYQYQISTAYSPPPVAAPVVQAPTPAQPALPVKQTKSKLRWSVLIGVLFVVGLVAAAGPYFFNSTSTPAEVKNTGQITQPPTRPASPTATALPPTITPDQAGANFKGPTPGIGADKPVTSVQVSGSDLPVYPGARRIDSPGAGVYFTQYITTDGFDKLSDWARTAFTDKGWTNVEVKPLPGKEGAVMTGQKGSMSMVTYLLGPGQKDTAPYDNFFKSANVEPNGAVVVINITAS